MDRAKAIYTNQFEIALDNFIGNRNKNRFIFMNFLKISMPSYSIMDSSTWTSFP